MAEQATAGRHAVVVGGSMAGLVAARVLADRFERVTVVDRDTPPETPVSRKGVPQGRHAHGLLAAGEQVLRRQFPGIMDELAAEGAVTVGALGDARWWQAGGYRTREGEDFQGMFCTRPLLEAQVRARVAALPNVALRWGVGTKALAAQGGRVVGVEIDDPTEGASILEADLVVDASGRGSQAPAWLEAIGAEAPPVSQVKMDMGYASRLVRRAPGATNPWYVTIGEAPSQRLGVMFPVEGDAWMVTLCGFHGDHCSTDDDAFLAFAESLPTQDIANVLRGAEKLSPIVTHRMPSNQRRHFESLKRPPAGFVALGDSVCSFNPVYGQGMSSAALQAEALGRAIDQVGATSAGLPRRFYKAAKKVVDIPWQIAAGADFALPQTTGPKPPGTDVVNRYLAKVFVAAQHDGVVARAITDVQHLLAPPPSMMKPAMAWRVLRTAKRGPVGGATPAVRAETPADGRVPTTA